MEILPVYLRMYDCSLELYACSATQYRSAILRIRYEPHLDCTRLMDGSERSYLFLPLRGCDTSASRELNAVQKRVKHVRKQVRVADLMVH